MWDVRAPAQESMVKVFECMHFDQVNQIEKINEEIFCSASNDGTVNIWNLRMNNLMKVVNISKDSRVMAVKFLKQRYMLAVQENTLTLMDVNNDFEVMGSFTPPIQEE